MDLELTQVILKPKGGRLTNGGFPAKFRPLLRLGLPGWAGSCPSVLLQDGYCRERKITGVDLQLFFVSDKIRPQFTSGGDNYFSSYLRHLRTLYPEGWRWRIVHARDLVPYVYNLDINPFEISFCGEE